MRARRLTDLLVFVGPSGCGKSTIIQKLRGEFPSLFSFSTSHTTREPRHGEVNGRDYYFVSKPQFEKMLAGNAFVEHTELDTSSSSGDGDGAARAGATMTYYGTSKRALHDVLAENKVVLMDTDVLGAIHIRRFCEGSVTPVALGVDGVSAPAGTSPSVCPMAGKTDDDTMALRALRCKVFFIAPPSMEELSRRLRARKSESEETLTRRLSLGKEWMAWADTNATFFDHRLVNDDLEVCYAAVRRIVLTEVVTIQSTL